MAGRVIALIPTGTTQRHANATDFQQRKKHVPATGGDGGWLELSIADKFAVAS